MQGQDSYRITNTYSFPNMTVRVHRPDLTPEEYSRRMRYIQGAATELLKTQERKKQQ